MPMTSAWPHGESECLCAVLDLLHAGELSERVEHQERRDERADGNADPLALGGWLDAPARCLQGLRDER